MIGLKKALRLCLFMTLISLAACSNSEGKSKLLYETAQFEEAQSNLKHARQLYQEIVSDYPESEAAPKAKARLEALKAESEPQMP